MCFHSVSDGGISKRHAAELQLQVPPPAHPEPRMSKSQPGSPETFKPSSPYGKRKALIRRTPASAELEKLKNTDSNFVGYYSEEHMIISYLDP